MIILPVAAVRSYLLLSEKGLFGPPASKGVRWFSFAASMVSGRLRLWLR
ncbi:hypothetical protein CLOLEP_00329 [[Clostridium] leptum DSM 753]|uniref:Uncharacterized protein n=1 Tax=[Clostridium] leptum DSM 753 TaxID=428125 RepID=A7VP54_9FIRM|nr:hypothetical protein CLOLEP_00329 [[Clostridium] leptum DSM 753]